MSELQSAFQQLSLIRTLFDAAERREILLWLESGWAIDARLGKITRKHDDIDIAFAAEKESDYRELLELLGFDEHENTDYGFLSWNAPILVDSEPCFAGGEGYNFVEFPNGSCPLGKQGDLQGYRVRCLSWAAMFFEFLGYEHEVAINQWREKDSQSLSIIESHLSEDEKRALRERFAATQKDKSRSA